MDEWTDQELVQNLRDVANYYDIRGTIASRIMLEAARRLERASKGEAS